MRKNKEALNNAIEQLKGEIKKYREEITDKLQTEIDKNRIALFESLLPAVRRNPPSKWLNRIGSDPHLAEVEAMLDNELDRAFGSAEQLLRGMEVQVLFKGVTYEMLNDPKFV